MSKYLNAKHDAELLFNKYKGFVCKDDNDADFVHRLPNIAAKQCAIMCVREILKSFGHFMDQREHYRHPLEVEAVRHWESVLNEIINIKTTTPNHESI